MDVDDDVVEIPPPIHLLKNQKKRRAILHDVINIDDDSGSEDLVIVGEKVNKSKKGKTHEATHQVVEVSNYTSIWPGVEDFGPAILHGVIDIDNGDDSDDLVVIGEKIGKCKTGKTGSFSSQLFSKTAVNKKKSAASRHNGRGLNLSVRVESSKSESFLKSFGSKMKSARFNSKHRDLAINSEVKNMLPPSAINFFMKQAAISRRSHHTIMRKFQNFKQFDFVKFASDHHFIRENSSMEQHSKSWVKVIQKEWKILEESLPDSIFVRVYESRMDLLRAVIVGVEGTPYHNGLFCFDLYFPRDYPNVPPRLHARYSHPEFNPIFSHGGLCLSLLNTLPGEENERWIPRVSTILQVLVSIQGLVLNANPFFGHATSLLSYVNGKVLTSTDIERVTVLNNERAFTHSLFSMGYMMTRPPKDFENFVAGHFVSRAHDILGSCNAYIENVQVGGSLFKDGACDVDEEHVAKKYGCSHAQLVDRVRGYMNRLVINLFRIGAKDCEKFLSVAIVKRGLDTYKFSEKMGYRII